MNLEKLEKLKEQVRIGGKGTPRRKVKKSHKSSTAAEALKLSATLKKVNAQQIPAIEEVNMFRSDGQVIHFVTPKVQAAVNANTFVVSGLSEEKGKSK